ncbi:hypothetical protein FOZ63_027595 [Perkinsus olseni]|uniref:Uncharacterized protein n=1 Tax=Perkinsus olseni TaxID=32597 RepID=A0A7J6UIU4_PEROL|nr:hypothetical protein FOZ62_023562 [Perkinsus olseni]KAF4757189.1 hypothetical protein FOZ63_027595 [Perkinsus olseni]
MNSRKLKDDSSSESGMSPFELMMARPPRYPTVSTLERLCDDLCTTSPVAELPKPPSVEVASKQRKLQRRELRKEFQHVWENLRERSRTEQQSRASKSVAPSLAVGDKVFLSKPRKHKLDVGWKGRYPVKAIQGVKVTVDMNGRDVVDSTSNVLKLVLWFSSGTQRQAGCLKVQDKIC